MKDLFWLVGLLVGLVIGFWAGAAYEKNQHDRIDIRVPGFQYQQR
jgi:hypothetical protein